MGHLKTIISGNVKFYLKNTPFQKSASGPQYVSDIVLDVSDLETFNFLSNKNFTSKLKIPYSN